jgi:aminopeptidase N
MRLPAATAAAATTIATSSAATAAVAAAATAVAAATAATAAIAATTATSSAATAVAATATRRASFTWARFIHSQWPAFHRLSVELGDRLLRIRIRSNGDKGEAARLPRKLILHQRDLLHWSRLSEKILKIGFGRVEGKIPYV